MRRLTKDAFFIRAHKIHGDSYLYVVSEDFHSWAKVSLYCKKHKEWHIMTGHSILMGCGCPKCGRERMAASKLSNRAEFIKKAHRVHGNAYNYEKSVYLGSKKPITITCPVHGDFTQHSAQMHLLGHGCPLCKASHLERNMWKYLETTGVSYAKQYSVLDDKSDGMHKLRFDFVIFNTDNSIRCFIECQGRQHYEPVSIFGGKAGFNKQQARDLRKRNYCEQYGIQLLEYTYQQDFLDFIEEAGSLLY